MHGEVVDLVRDRQVEHFLLVQQSHHQGVRPEHAHEGTVVGPTAPTDPASTAVDAQGGDQHDLRPSDGIRTKAACARLEHAPCRRGEPAGPGVARPVKVPVVEDDRQQGLYPALLQLIEQGAGSGLTAHRDVAGDRAGVCDGGFGQQDIAQRPCGFGEVAGAEGAPSLEQPTPQGLLGLADIWHGSTLGACPSPGTRPKVNGVSVAPNTNTPSPAGAAVTKAVIPAAGLGTRFLPATKATPKEMLPVVDTPAIQLVVEEAVSAGLPDILMITGRNKRPLEDHFDRNWELEHTLEQKGEHDRLEKVHRSTRLADVFYVRQGDPRGLGHAVACAADHVGREPFAVLLGDDLIDERDPLLTRMIDVRRRYGSSVIALIEVEPASIGLYGCAAAEPTDADDVVRVHDLVEKPDPADAPSNLAVIGRYVLDPAVFDVLASTPPGRGGEIQLTDALMTLAGMPAEDGGGVHGVLFRGRRYDTGDRLDYLRTIVRLASEREDLGPDFTAWLREFVSDLPQADG